MTDEEKFCFKCGAMLPDGADFCPECGASLRAEGERTVPEPEVRTAVRSDSLGAIPALILIYGIFALIVAFFYIISGIMLDSLLDMFKDYAERGIISMDDYNQFLEMIGAATEEGRSTLKLNLTIEGILFAVSGIAAVVSSRYCGKLENYKRAFYLCFAATILVAAQVFLGDITGLILAAVGLVMCYLLYRNREKFTS